MAIDISKLTVGELREIAQIAGSPCGTRGSKRLPMPIGTKVFIRTVTHHHTGRVVDVSEEEVRLADAAWIADDGRFHNAMKDGTLSEIEPFADGMNVTLNRASFIDWVEWPHDLPRCQK